MKDPNTVYVTPSDKEALSQYIEAIKVILDKYPFYADNSRAVTSMWRCKTACSDLHLWIHLLECGEYV